MENKHYRKWCTSMGVDSIEELTIVSFSIQQEAHLLLIPDDRK